MNSYLSSSLLSWLRCFETTARHASFTKAAWELNITQGAVSQQVKRLEDWAGLPLFNRTPRALTLTAKGAKLYAVVTESLQEIKMALSQLRSEKVSDPLHLSCSSSFAMLWLMPRLGDFFRDHSGLGLRVFAEYHALDHALMVHQGIEGAIRFDLGSYTNVNCTKFLDELLFPVASPAFVEAHPEIKTPQDLTGSFLLHDVTPWDGADEFEEWDSWLRAAGVRLPDVHKGQRFNLSQLAISAAVAGQGIAIGRSALMIEDIIAGRLIDLFGILVPSKAAYYFISASEFSTKNEVIVDWLTKEAKHFEEKRNLALMARR